MGVECYTTDDTVITSETDPVVAAINGIPISNGTTISAAVDGEDYLSPALTGIAYVAKTGTYTVTTSDCIVECTANSFTLTLPTAVGNAGKVYYLTNSGAGTITIEPDGAELINGYDNAQLYQNDSITIVSTNTNWRIV